MSPALEAIAAALLLVNVWLVARRSLWNYAFGIAAVTLYAAVFWEARLYAAFGLQLLFLGLNLYGLMHWRQAQRATGDIAVGCLGWPARIATLGAIVALAAAIALLFGAHDRCGAALVGFGQHSDGTGSAMVAGAQAGGDLAALDSG